MAGATMGCECQQMDGQSLVCDPCGSCSGGYYLQADLWDRAGKTENRLHQDEDPALWQADCQKCACAQFARTMSTLMAAGISTTECLDTVTKIINNIHYKNALQKAKEEVMKGIPLSEPPAASEVFPPMVYHMTGIGEETGNMEEMLNKLADYYDEEVEITTQSVLAAMEPLIIVFMALIVGTLVIAVLMPMRTMYDGLGSL